MEINQIIVSDLHKIEVVIDNEKFRGENIILISEEGFRAIFTVQMINTQLLARKQEVIFSIQLQRNEDVNCLQVRLAKLRSFNGISLSSITKVVQLGEKQYSIDQSLYTVGAAKPDANYSNISAICQ